MPKINTRGEKEFSFAEQSSSVPDLLDRVLSEFSRAPDPSDMMTLIDTVVQYVSGFATVKHQSIQRCLSEGHLIATKYQLGMIPNGDDTSDARDPESNKYQLHFISTKMTRTSRALEEMCLEDAMTELSPMSATTTFQVHSFAESLAKQLMMVFVDSVCDICVGYLSTIIKADMGKGKSNHDPKPANHDKLAKGETRAMRETQDFCKSRTNVFWVSLCKAIVQFTRRTIAKDLQLDIEVPMSKVLHVLFEDHQPLFRFKNGASRNFDPSTGMPYTAEFAASRVCGAFTACQAPPKVSASIDLHWLRTADLLCADRALFVLFVFNCCV